MSGPQKPKDVRRRRRKQVRRLKIRQVVRALKGETQEAPVVAQP